MGANGCNPQEFCKRNHELFPGNTQPASGGGRRCKACNRATSHVNNHRVRFGSILDLETVADEKYQAILATRPLSA